MGFKIDELLISEGLTSLKERAGRIPEERIICQDGVLKGQLRNIHSLNRETVLNLPGPAEPQPCWLLTGKPRRQTAFSNQQLDNAMAEPPITETDWEEQSTSAAAASLNTPRGRFSRVLEAPRKPRVVSRNSTRSSSFVKRSVTGYSKSQAIAAPTCSRPKPNLTPVARNISAQGRWLGLDLKPANCRVSAVGPAAR